MKNSAVHAVGVSLVHLSFATAGAGILLVACGSDRGGLTTSSTVATGSGGGGQGGAAGGAGTQAGAGGAPTGGTGGTSTSGTGGTGGANDAGDADRDGATDGGAVPACIFHTDPPLDAGTPLFSFAPGGDDPDDPDANVDAAVDADRADAADGDVADVREGGRSEGGSDAGSRADADSGGGPSITIQVSPFVGPYLADSNGRALYTYGGDMAGDCKYAPVSGCEKDCVISWPIFEAGPRTLAPGLSDAAFGTIRRQDDVLQTTYYGWPLYYYRTDTGPGMLLGQAKARTWHAATIIPPAVTILRSATIMRYVADGAGKTLYVYDQDTKGTATTDPVSACTGACLAEHPPFWRNRLSVVSSLEPTDFSVFSPGHGRQQLAYKGAPLYYSAADARSGDVNGAATGWSVSLP